MPPRHKLATVLVVVTYCRGILQAGVEQHRGPDVTVSQQAPHDLVGPGLLLELDFGCKVSEQMRIHLQPCVLEDGPADARPEYSTTFGTTIPCRKERCTTRRRE